MQIDMNRQSEQIDGERDIDRDINTYAYIQREKDR